MMNREHWKKLLPFITAYAEGGTIQLNHHSEGGWKDVVDPCFSADPEQYRIKPEPVVFWGIRFVNRAGNTCVSSYMETTELAAERFGRCQYGDDFIGVVRFKEVIE